MEDFVRVELNRHKDGFKCIKHTWINSIDASRCKTQTQRRGGAAMRAYKIGGGSRFVICRSALNLRFATPKTKQNFSQASRYSTQSKINICELECECERNRQQRLMMFCFVGNTVIGTDRI